LRDAEIPELIEHARTLADIVPVVGFYLQPSIGGRVLPYRFWRAFCEIENVVAIKIAPFNRYQTMDVLRAVAESGRAEEIALYTGNDDNIVPDLVTEYASSNVRLRFAGGLLGHWAVWTRCAVALLERMKAIADSIPRDLLTLGQQVTDMNAAIFDAANGFHGCIAGVHEVLRRQRLMAGRWCLDEREELSPGQMEEIDRVCTAYPHLQDDHFVSRHVDQWMR
jgi:hypothetical protein